MMQKKYEEASQVANDAVGSIRTVASFCAEDKVMALYKKKCEGPMKAGMKRGIVSGVGFGFSFFALFAVYAASFYAGARFVEDGKATFAEVFRVSHLPPPQLLLFRIAEASTAGNEKRKEYWKEPVA